MRPDNGTLAEHPDLFAYTRSPAKTATFAVLAVLLLAGAVICALSFDAVQEFGAGLRGRSGRVLGPYLGYLAPAVLALLALLAGVHASRTGVWTRSDGRALEQQSWALSGDPEMTHQRLATGNPQAYLPLPVTRRDDARRRLRAYTVDGAPITYLTVTAGGGKSEAHWPLITLEGPAHQAFQQVRSRLGKPLKG